MSGIHRQGFPGLSGFYAVTEDINLLPADDAHLYQSVGNWVDDDAGAAISLVDVDWSYSGKAGEFIASGASDPDVYTDLGSPYDLPVGSYVFGVDVDLLTAGAMTSLQARTVAVGATLANNSHGSHTLAVGRERLVSTFDVTVAGTVRLVLNAGSGESSAWRWGDVILADDSLSDGTFYPSLRIVGDLDLRAYLAADDYTPTANQWIIGNRNGLDGYGLLLLTTGIWYPYHGDGTVSRSLSVDLGTLVDGTAYDVRVTFTQSDGKWRGYLDGELLYTTALTNTNDGSPSGSVLAVGSSITGGLPYDGEIYSAEIRDGIDGPIVARWSAGDAWEEAT